MVEANVDSSYEVFPKLDVEKTHWVDLFVDFMLQNKPCILKPSATKNWKSRQKWVLKSQDGTSTPNFDYFSETYGNLVVPVVDEETCQQTYTRLSEYMQFAKYSDNCGDKYLKDWHFQKDSGTSYEFYALPTFLSFDWINNEKWSDDANPFGDYRFVYFGVKNTWTIFHSDVMSSYSWSANVCGRKLWYFVPINNEHYFQLCRDTYVRDIRKKAEKWDDAKVISFIQEPGEIVFVPSNWYHQVHNLEDAISINHNFFNASNIDLAFRMLCDRLSDVREEISDVRDVFTEEEFEDQCQKILKADIRINFQMLLNLLDLVVEDRQQKVDECWICPKHRNIFDCKKDEKCMEYLKAYVKRRCICTNLQSMCKNCAHIIHGYELSCAAQCRDMINCYKKI